MNNMEHVTQHELDRFNSAWEQSGKCKLWKRFLDKDGYGSFYFRKALRRAHRVAYYIANGPIDDGFVIDHICKKRDCVAIEHLRLITAKQNSLDNSKSVGAINSRKQFCKNGHRFDRVYGKQRYCSVCQSEKTKRLRKKWREQAKLVKC